MGNKSIIGETMLDAISIVVQFITVIIIGRYDPSHSSGPMLCPTWPDNAPWTSPWQSCQQLEIYPTALMSSVFDDPSPAAFLGALAVFTLATLYLYNFHKEARYRNYCLFAVIVAAAITSITRQIIFHEEPLAHSIQISLPSNIILSSIVNVIIHRIRSLTLPRKQEPEWKQKERTNTEGQAKGEKQVS